MRLQGKITHWKDDQGFGFITPDGGGTQVFVHIKSFATRQSRPVGNDAVTYELKFDARGRAQADRVVFDGGRVPSAASSGRSNVKPILAVVFLILVTGTAFTGRLPIAVPMLYLIASTIAFAAYWHDKSAARNDRRRTPENTLHFIALIGGWPGALAAQRLLRHKSRKLSFQIVFWVTVVLNCGAFGWSLTPEGTGTLRSVLAAARPAWEMGIRFTREHGLRTFTF